MPVHAEFYNPNGDLVLSKDDTALVDGGNKLYIPSNSNSGSGYSYVEDLNTFQDAQSGDYRNPRAKCLNFSVVDNASPYWYKPREGTNILIISRGVVGVGTTGGGVDIVQTPLRNLNQYSGYFDVYKEDGSLAWSVNSIIEAPKIIDVIQLPDTMRTREDVVVIDLSRYGYDTNKIYALATFTGRLYMDEISFEYTGILIKRSGNSLYIRGFMRSVGDPSVYPLSQTFGAGGIYIPLAYFPNS